MGEWAREAGREGADRGGRHQRAGFLKNPKNWSDLAATREGAGAGLRGWAREAGREGTDKGGGAHQSFWAPFLTTKRCAGSAFGLTGEGADWGWSFCWAP